MVWFSCCWVSLGDPAGVLGGWGDYVYIFYGVYCVYCLPAGEVRQMTAKIYGHRGAMGERPENTLEGFLYAQSLGVAGIETDIVLTRDLVPVLRHDANLADGRCWLMV